VGERILDSRTLSSFSDGSFITELVLLYLVKLSSAMAKRGFDITWHYQVLIQRDLSFSFLSTERYGGFKA
jgi:hypothetical protein